MQLDLDPTRAGYAGRALRVGLFVRVGHRSRPEP
jgi:hypothetical protein